ncbi:hypothetical protein CMI48_00530 [Candidatus Pacearchaeota archaeon]|nr:hypothetical protein [Candidatus Pacearchaeota archaeon]
MEGKRGQMPFEYMVGLVIIVIVGAIIIIGSTQGFGFIFDKFKVLPGQNLEAVVQSCNLAIKNGLVASACVEFKEVKLDGSKQYVNCEFGKIAGLLDKAPTCPSGTTTDARETDKCNGLYASGGKSIQSKICDGSILVNGKGCGAKGPTPFGIIFTPAC